MQLDIRSIELLGRRGVHPTAPSDTASATVNSPIAFEWDGGPPAKRRASPQRSARRWTRTTRTPLARPRSCCQSHQATIAGVTYNASTRVTTLSPNPTLPASTTYTATVAGGASGMNDLVGNALAVNRQWSFTTR